MVLHAEQERVRQLMAEALPMLCKNGINFNSEFCIEALIGITVDKDEVILVSVKESFNRPGVGTDTSLTQGAQSLISHRPQVLHRKRPYSQAQQNSSSEFEGSSPIKREKTEIVYSSGSSGVGNLSKRTGKGQVGEASFVKEEIEEDSFGDLDATCESIESDHELDDSHLDATFEETAPKKKNEIDYTQDISTWVWRSLDGSRIYTYLEGSTSKGASQVMDDRGYFYIKKNGNNWNCNRTRRKSDRCTASVKQKPEGFVEFRNHNHDPEPEKLTTILLRREIKNQVSVHHSYTDVSSLVREIYARNVTESARASGSIPNIKALIKYGQRVKCRKIKEQAAAVENVDVNAMEGLPPSTAMDIALKAIDQATLNSTNIDSETLDTGTFASETLGNATLGSQNGDQETLDSGPPSETLGSEGTSTEPIGLKIIGSEIYSSETPVPKTFTTETLGSSFVHGAKEDNKDDT